jgi:LPS sulfotransferase NodH
MDLDGVVIMLARQRSGTNALRDVLQSHPDIFCTPEVFHERPSPDAYLEVETNFWNFLEEHPAGTVRRSQSLETQREIFVDYMGFLRSFTDKRYVVVDVKYNSTHHLDGPWRGVAEQPSMFVFMKRSNLRTLNLTRLNYLRYYLSWYKAQATRAWAASADSGTAHRDQRVRLEPERVLWALELCRAEDEVVGRSLSGYSRYKSLDYDDLFPVMAAPPSAQALGWIAEWLGVAATFAELHPQYRKQAVLGLRETIENYDEIASALQGTRFEYCLEDESMYRNPSAGREALLR